MDETPIVLSNEDYDALQRLLAQPPRRLPRLTATLAAASPFATEVSE